MSVKSFPKYLYLTGDHWLSEKMGSESYHQLVLELVEPINTSEKLNEYITLFKLTGEIERTNCIKDSELGRLMIINYKGKTDLSSSYYSQNYADYMLIPGKIAVYKCVAIDKANPARIEINRKAKETRKKREEIQKNSKTIEWMNSKHVCLHKKVIWDIVKKELKPLGISMDKIFFEVANWQKEEKGENDKKRNTI